MNAATVRPVARMEYSGTPPGARGLRLGGVPTVSIVVASRSDLPGLERVLDALRPTCREHGVELVVVRAGPAREIQELGARFPDVLFMPAPDDCTERALRGYGLAAADGDIVVITDDARLPDADWLKDAMALREAAPRA